MDRFKDLIWFKSALKRPVTVVGVGGIGSFTAFFLARAGFATTLIDHDIIDNTNMSGQLFSSNQVLMPKVDAIKETIQNFGGTKVAITLKQKFTRNSINQEDFIHPITIVGTDNMISRKEVFNTWKRKYLFLSDYKKDIMFVDGRLNAESFQIFCIRNEEDAERYEKYLYDDSEIPEVSCTAKQTSHYAGGIAFNITRFVTNKILIEQGLPADVPFEYNYNEVLQQVEPAFDPLKIKGLDEIKKEQVKDVKSPDLPF